MRSCAMRFIPVRIGGTVRMDPYRPPEIVPDTPSLTLPRNPRIKPGEGRKGWARSLGRCRAQDRLVSAVRIAGIGVAITAAASSCVPVERNTVEVARVKFDTVGPQPVAVPQFTR